MIKRIGRLFGSVTSIKTFGQKPVSAKADKESFEFPRRHPVKLNEDSHEIVSYKIPNRPLTPLFQVPIEARMPIFPYFEPPKDAKVSSIAVLGAANAGKSLLVNALVGAQVTIVSRKAHTTRKNWTVAKTSGETQLLFIDTPGVTSSQPSLTRQIQTLGWEAVNESNFTLFVVDAVKRLQNDVLSAASRLQKLLAEDTPQEIKEVQLAGETVAQSTARGKSSLAKIPAVLVMNKVDLVIDRSHVKSSVRELFEYANFSEVFYVSALTGYGLDKLETYLKSTAVEGPFVLHPLQQSEASDVERAEEIVRCHLLDLYHAELPYTWLIRTVGWTPYLDGTLRIDVDIYVKTEVHKGILLGRESKCIKQLWLNSRTDLVKLYQRPINLVMRAKLLSEFDAREVARGVDYSDRRNTRLVTETALPPRLTRLIQEP